MSRITQSRRRLVLVGNGMIGIRAVEEILRQASDAFTITVYGAEPFGAYNRILLSPVLAGEKSLDAIITHDRAWYGRHGIELIAGEAAVAIDRSNRIVTGEHGTSRPYDVLLLATGSNPVIIPVAGHDLPGVIGFREIADVRTMQRASRTGAHAVVIGGGLLGLEAANGLACLGLHTTVLHLPATLMDRQLDPTSAGLLRADLTRRGITILTEANTKAIRGRDRVETVELTDGRELAADLVVMAAGVRPNIALGRTAGLACGRGILVNDGMRTSDPAIFAIGECAEHRGTVYGLVAPLYDMAKTAADRITGVAATDYAPPVTDTRLKVTGIDMASVGEFHGSDTSEEIVFHDRALGIHKRLVVRDDRLIGAVLYGDARDSPWYLRLIREQADIAPWRDTLVFGPPPNTDMSKDDMPNAGLQITDTPTADALSPLQRTQDRPGGPNHAPSGQFAQMAAILPTQLPRGHAAAETARAS